MIYQQVVQLGEAVVTDCVNIGLGRPNLFVEGIWGVDNVTTR